MGRVHQAGLHSNCGYCSAGGAAALADFLADKADARRPLIYYLAVAPVIQAKLPAVKEAGLALPQSRVVVEKPLGNDYAC